MEAFVDPEENAVGGPAFSPDYPDRMDEGQSIGGDVAFEGGFMPDATYGEV
ncbi:MAG: hypothetical protein WCC64_21910 [Aliidongia sp.]